MLILVKYGCDNVADCHKFSLALPGDQIILIQNGVFWAISDDIDPYLEKGIEIYAIEPDFDARGFAKEDAKVPLISYNGFIELLEKTEKTLG